MLCTVYKCIDIKKRGCQICSKAQSWLQVTAIFFILGWLFDSLDINEIWHVGRGRWVMHDGMQYDPIQGHGNEPFDIRNPAIFNNYLLRHLQWELATDHTDS